MKCIFMTLITQFWFKLPKSIFDLFEREGLDTIKIKILIKAKIYAKVLLI